MCQHELHIHAFRIELGTHIRDDYADPKYGDPYGYIQIGPPVLDDKSTSSEVSRRGHAIIEEVVPASREAVFLESASHHGRGSRWKWSYPKAGSTIRPA